MQITLAMVTSLDGKATKWEDANIYSWTSPEDQTHFFKLRDTAPVIIMGRKTFEAAQPVMKLSASTLRIVMTRNPDSYSHLMVPNQLEFTTDSPAEMVTILENRGCSKALLVGGGEISAAFFDAQLINDVWLTLEPTIFGEGKQLVAAEKLAVELQLESMEKINSRGTLLLHYTVL